MRKPTFDWEAFGEGEGGEPGYTGMGGRQWRGGEEGMSWQREMDHQPIKNAQAS